MLEGAKNGAYLFAHHYGAGSVEISAAYQGWALLYLISDLSKLEVGCAHGFGFLPYDEIPTMDLRVPCGHMSGAVSSIKPAVWGMKDANRPACPTMNQVDNCPVVQT